MTTVTVYLAPLTDETFSPVVFDLPVDEAVLHRQLSRPGNYDDDPIFYAAKTLAGLDARTPCVCGFSLEAPFLHDEWEKARQRFFILKS